MGAIALACIHIHIHIHPLPAPLISMSGTVQAASTHSQSLNYAHYGRQKAAFVPGQGEVPGLDERQTMEMAITLTTRSTAPFPTFTQSVDLRRFAGDPCLLRRRMDREVRKCTGTARQRWYDRHRFLAFGTAHASTSTSTSTPLKASSINNRDWK
jgi:hypothetical protein